jgi:integrase
MLRRFCQRTGYDPDGLTQLHQREVERLIQDYADEKARAQASRAYVNTIIKRLRTFYRVNGFEDLKLQVYHQPTRYRKRPEYIPSKGEVHAMANAAGSTRDRAIILGLWSCGLRVSTLCALNHGDIAEELEFEERCLRVQVYPGMKARVSDACKGEVPYYSFLCVEAGEALRVYLREREERYGRIGFDDPLFHSEWNLWYRDERSRRRLGRRGVGLVVKRAARFSGLGEWERVTPHCLRKAFESVLRSPCVDGSRMDKGTQEFFFGHILPGVQDTYYDRTKVDFHRNEYSKLDFSTGGVSDRGRDKLIDIGELEGHFEEGWMFVSRIGDGKVVVRRGV